MSSVAPGLYLASASPRRRELLLQIGMTHLVLAQQLDESVQAGEAPEKYVERLAVAKALAGWNDPRRTLPLPVLAADTSVVCEGCILGKPSTLEEARTMLGMLSGRSHQVLTGIAAVQHGICRSAVVSTEVRFKSLSLGEIDAYWHSGEPHDKAGGYGIQGRGALFVAGISGSYSNVVGLPLFETVELLKNFGISAESLLQGGSDCSGDHRGEGNKS